MNFCQPDRHSSRTGPASHPDHRRARLWLAGVSVLALLAAGPAALAADVTLDGGTTVISGSGGGTYPSPWILDGNLTLAATKTTKLKIENGGIIRNGTTTAGLGPPPFSSGWFSAQLDVDGTGSRLENTLFILGDTGLGQMTIRNGATVNTSWQAVVGDDVDSQGNVGIYDAGSSWTVGGGLFLGNYGGANVSVSDGALLRADYVHLAAGFDGWNAGSGSLGVYGDETARGVLETGMLLGGSGTISFAMDGGILRPRYSNSSFMNRSLSMRIDTDGAIIDSNGFDITIDATLRGVGGLTKRGEGVLTLSGDNTYRGPTVVENGTLLLDGTWGDLNPATTPAEVTVRAGAAFGGNGTLDGSATIEAGGKLAGRSGRSLTVNGDLLLTSGSRIDLALASATPSPFFIVNGTLVLDGTLDIGESVYGPGYFGPGIYRLFDYRGALVDRGLLLGTLPNGALAENFEFQTSVNGQINLVYTTLRDGYTFWDGPNPALYDNSRIDGGTGTWTLGGAGWADQQGMVNTTYDPTDFAVFQGTAGVVTVDGSGGAVGVAGLQFATGGYRLAGDPLRLDGGAETVLRVGDGSPVSGSMFARIDTALTGHTTLVKTDQGTVLLTGANSYVGGTRIEAGTLRLDGAGRLGTGMLDLSAGTTLDLGQTIQTVTALSGAGRITDYKLASGINSHLIVDQASDTTFAGSVQNGSTEIAVTKSGSGTLSLTGQSTLRRLSASGGEVRLTGTGARLTATAYLGIGETAAGRMTVANGATVTSRDIHFGAGAGTDGTLTVTGSGSSISTQLMIIGQLAEGHMVVENGGLLETSGNVFLGTVAGQRGDARISGAGARWESTGDIQVGLASEGAVTIENGGLVDATKLHLGQNGGAVGTVTVTGTAAARGILKAGSITEGSGTGRLVFDGGILRPQADEGNFLRAFEPGDVEIAAGGLYYEDGGYNVTISMRLSGTGALVKRGTGTLTLMDRSLHSGGTVIEQGVLHLDGLSGGLSTPTGALRIESGGLLALGGNGPVSVGSLSGGGTITNWDPGSRHFVAVNQTGDTTFSGSLVNGAGDVDLLVSGTGTLTLTGNNTHRLTVAERGNLTIAAGGRVTNDTVHAGFGSVITVTGTGSHLDTGILRIGEGEDATLRIADGGRVTVGSTFTLGSSNLSDARGEIQLDGTAGARGVLVTGGMARGTGSAALRINGGMLTANADNGNFLAGFTPGSVTIQSGGGFIDTNGHDIGIATGLTGPGRLTKQGTGTLALSGVNDAANRFTGEAVVSAGTLGIYGLFGDTVGRSARVTANGSGQLTGTGRIAGSVLVDHGGTLQGRSGDRLTIDGDLAFASGGILKVSLGAVGNAALFSTGGNLTLDGRLDVADAGGFGAGIYRLIDYAGRLTDRGLNIGSLAGGIQPGALSIQTGIAGQVNLVNASGLTLGFWDGGAAGHHSNGRIDGGSGLWSMDNELAGPNWTGANGTLNGGYNPNPTYAVFQGEAGTVTVDTDAGAIGVTGLQFAVDGYRLQGDAIRLQGGSGETVIRVGDGSAAGAGMTATIAASLTGASKLIKDDLGTLVLSGSNSHTGGTELRGGTLSISADAALGAAGGGLIFSGGTLSTTDSLTSARNIQLTGPAGGIVDVAGGTETDFLGVIGGNRLTKRGAGTLALGGTNSFSGGTFLEAGTLRLMNERGLGSGSVRMAGGTTLSFAASPYATLGPVALDGNVTFSVDAGQDASLYRRISGQAGFEKTGRGTLSLYGDNSFTGNVRVREGELWLDNWQHAENASLADTARLTVDSGASAAFQRGETIGELTGGGTVDITYGGFSGLTVGAADTDFTFDGTLTGYGFGGSGYGLQKTGSGTFTLTGISDTDRAVLVSGGRLAVDGALTSRRVDVTDGARLAGSGEIAGSVAIGRGAVLEGRSGQTLSMGALTLDAGASLNVALGRAGGASLFSIAGNLTLDGRLNISDAGGFSAGVYRLMTYGGTLTDRGLDIAAAPTEGARESLALQTAVAGQVNLISTVGARLNFWDGGNAALHGNVRIDGGSGLWAPGGRNWTDSAGIRNGPYGSTPSFAIFQGTGGTVTLAGGIGETGVTGLQFAADGYRIEGEGLALKGDNGETVIRVGDGTAAGAAMTATIAASLSGRGDLVKDDRGTLILTGANRYAGNTLVRAGTLRGDAGALKGNIGNAGTVVFDQAGEGTFAGTIGALAGRAGSMVKEGAGRLTLSGKSALDWTVREGELRSATGRFEGDVTLATGARFTLSQKDAGLFGGVLSGTGTFGVTGGGTVLLAGDNGGFRGLTSVLDATLMVDRKLGGSVHIGRGGRLEGMGTLGSGTGSTVTIGDGGTIAPGHSPGTLTVDGNLVLESASRYEVEAGPGAGGTDLIRVTGKADIRGGTVLQVGAGGGYDPGAAHRILTAEGGISGRFSQMRSDFAFLDTTLLYTERDVSLKLTRNGLAFETVARSRNQRATARALDGLPAGNSLHDRVVQLNRQTARSAFDQLSGEIHSSAATGLIEDSRHLRMAASDRLRAAFGEAAAPEAPVIAYGPDGSYRAVSPDDEGPVFWSSGFGSWSTGESDGNAAALDRSTRGMLFGADALFLDSWRIGLLAGYGHAAMDAAERASSLTASGYHAGLYAGTSVEGFSIRSGLAYSWYDLSSSRSIAFTGLAERLAGDGEAGLFQAFGEVSRPMDLGGLKLDPFAGLAHVRFASRGYQERGGLGALTGEGFAEDVTFATLGVRAEQPFEFGGTTGRLKATLGWRHAFGDLVPEATHRFAGSGLFSVGGTPIAGDSALLEAGIGFDLAPGASLDLSYSGQLSSTAREHGFKAQFNVRF